MTPDPDTPTAFSYEVGRRLRSVRKARRLSLEEVERKSGGRWSASAVGAYERGFRNLSLPRLHDLAHFYEVPMSVLLGELPAGGGRGPGEGKLVLDLERLNELTDDEARAVARFVHSIILERGDFNGRVLSIRHDDVRTLCAILDATEADVFATLRRWGALR